MRGFASGLLLLLVLPASARSQAVQADTLRFYNMEMHVSVVSGRQLLLNGLDTASNDVLADYGYDQVGEFYYREWVDPITDDSLFRIVGFSEDPSELGLEGTNLDRGGLLRASCRPGGERRVVLVTGGFLDGGTDGQIAGKARFDQLESLDSGNWSVSADHSGVRVPEHLFRSFWHFLGARDTLAVRLSDDAQQEFTYLFALDGFGKAVSTVGPCMESQ